MWSNNEHFLFHIRLLECYLQQYLLRRQLQNLSVLRILENYLMTVASWLLSVIGNFIQSWLNLLFHYYIF